jgi:hypothetical protein
LQRHAKKRFEIIFVAGPAAVERCDRTARDGLETSLLIYIRSLTIQSAEKFHAVEDMNLRKNPLPSNEPSSKKGLQAPDDLIAMGLPKLRS